VTCQPSSLAKCDCACTLLLCVQVLSLGDVCSADYNCLDCWRYSITQWQIVLIVIAFILLIVSLLAVRIKIVQRIRANEPVRLVAGTAGVCLGTAAQLLP
jgi:hypothetical protein